MKIFLSMLVLICSINSFAQIPTDYYDDAIGLTGYTLKSELHSIIKNGHINQGYSALYDGYESTDSDNYYENDGTVLDMYSENPTAVDPYNYTHGNNTCGTYTNEGDCYNREHLMPQSWFSSAQPMKSDIHHVVPSDGKVNGIRGHYPLANVASANWVTENGSKRGSCAVAGYSGTVFEPIDEFKGDIARIYFYMATRYENEIGSWENANSDGSDPVLDGSSDHVFENWYLDMLIAWHTADPVSLREEDRNNAAYNYQGNANPFIDHPEWVNAIWNPIPDTEAPSTPTNLIVDNETSNSFQLSWTASSDDIGVVGYDIFKNGSLIGTSSTTSYVLTGLNPSTSYNLYIVAKDAALNESANSTTIVGTTLATPIYLVNEDFNDCSTVGGSFYTYNEASDKDWTCIEQYGYDNTGCYQMNGYLGDVYSKDWLITTDMIDFTSYTNVFVSMYLINTYGDTILEFLYSTDYTGTGNPADFTWLPVPNVSINAPSGSNTESMQQITNANISSISQDAYLAFKYYSGEAPTRWNVDNFIISANNGIGTDEYNLQSLITVYPNPAKEILYLANDKSTILNTITLYSISGKLIKTFKNSSKSLSIDLKGIRNGVYYLHIETNNGSIFKKILIQ